MKLCASMEELLEVEKLENSENLANKEGEYAVLYDGLKNENKEEPEEDSEPTDDEAKTEISMLSYSRESYVDSYDNEPSKKGFAVAAGVLILIGVLWIPKIVDSLYKGVLYIFCELIKLLFRSTGMLLRYIVRHNNSFTNIKKEIEQLKQSIALIKNKPTQNNLSGMRYTEEKVINTLKIGDNVDFTANIKKMRDFMFKVISDIDTEIAEQTSSIVRLVNMSYNGTTVLPNNFMRMSPFTAGLTKSTLKGYESESDLVDSYRYNESLPSDVVLIADLPKSNLDESNIHQAYNFSRISLALDTQGFKDVTSVDYMAINELEEFVNELENLCNLCLTHQALYEKIKNNKSKLKYTFKSYFTNLVKSKKPGVSKLTVKESLVEDIYLKSMFIDKIYMIAAMDVHDYAVKVLTSATRYTEDNIKVLS